MSADFYVAVQDFIELLFAILEIAQVQDQRIAACGSSYARGMFALPIKSPEQVRAF